MSSLIDHPATRTLSGSAAVAALLLVVACGGSSGGNVDPADGAGSGSSSGSSGSSSGGTSSGSGSSSGGHAADSGAPSKDSGAPSKDSGSGGGHDSGSSGSDASAVDSGTTGDDASSSGGGGLDPSVAPGGNFDLSVWQLQEPYGSPGAPNTIDTAQLVGPKGFSDAYFFTDPTDGSMSFWDPENGVTTPNSNYPRSELREMNKDGSAANWLAPGTHTLTATVKATMIPDHVAVGQIHLGTGTPSSTKPLLELFYHSNGAVEMAIEQSPAGGNEIPYPIGNVPLGTQWSYVIGLSGDTISLVFNGGAPQTWTMSSTFDQEGMYFKAGDYDQSVGTSATVGAKVQFYALTVFHGP